MSPTLSWILRHGAPARKLTIRPGGFIPVTEILRLKEFHGATAQDIVNISNMDKKGRYSVKEIDGCMCIRANQGHSFPVDENHLLTPITEALQIKTCIHGTYKKHLDSIMKNGLSRMNRQHIHFAPSLDARSGMRRDCDVHIYIDVDAAMRKGCLFFVSENGVILTPGFDGILHPEYFKRVTQ